MRLGSQDPIHRTIQVHSKSFAWASRLLPQPARDHAVVVYAWCRNADDVVDRYAVDADDGQRAVQRLRFDLNRVYARQSLADPTLKAFGEVVRACEIPRCYPEELIAGLEMDVVDTHYDTMETLLRYSYRVAGTVGLMMCHVMGVENEMATRHAVHLGIAMQLTNICRDVAEDWGRGRLYLPSEWLARHGCPDLRTRLGSVLPVDAREAVAQTTRDLLTEADRYYQSGERGIPDLSWRCELAVRTAKHVYAAIGNRIEGQGYDPMAGRAFVPKRAKLGLTLRALSQSLAELPRRTTSLGAARRHTPRQEVLFPRDVLPL